MAAKAEVFARDEWRHSWQVVAASLAGITLCSSHGYTIGLMIGPLEEEFGWSRASISGGMLIIAFVAVILAPLAGRMADRFGPRRVALFGVPLFCLAFGMLGTATSDIRTWWALWLLLAIGNMCILPTIWSAEINRRFDRNRGMALAFALCGTGLAAFLLPPIGTRMIEHFGWRGAYATLALAGFLIVFPLTLFAFRSRRSAPPPAEVLAKFAPAKLAPGELRREFASPRFLKLLGASTIFSIAICALTTNSVPVLRSLGHSAVGAADIAALMGLGSVIGRLGGGFLLDRMDARKVAGLSVMAPVITALLLFYAGESQLVAMAACLILGLAIGTEVDACAYLAARHFGMKNFGALFGTINGLMLLGNGVAPFAANYIYDITRNYDAVLWAQVPACLASAVCFLMLGKYPDQEARKDPAGHAAPA